MMPYIPEELQTKITLMAYHLSPHPLASLIKESVSYECWGATLCVLNHYDFLDDVEWKYLRDKNFEDDLVIEIKFLPNTCDGLMKADFIINLDVDEYDPINDMSVGNYIEVKQQRAWKKNSPFGDYVKWLIKDERPFFELIHRKS